MTKLFALLPVVALAGCLSIPTSEVARSCNQISILYTAFLAVSVGGDIPASVQRNACTLYNAAQVICRDPASLNNDQALVRLAEVYAAIRLEMRKH